MTRPLLAPAIALMLLSGCASSPPRSAAEEYELGTRYATRNEPDEAVKHLQAALALDPSSVDAWITLGKAHSATKAHDKAIEAFSHALALDPGRALSYTLRANEYWATGQWQHVESDASRAIELAPTAGLPWQQRAVARTASGNLEGARGDMREALRLGELQGLVSSWLFTLAGELLMVEGDFAGSAALFRKAANLGLDDGTVSLWLYTAQRRAGVAVEQARAELRTQRALLKEDAWPVRMIDHALGSLSAQQATAAAPPDEVCQVRFHLALIERADGDATSARQAFEAALQPCRRIAPLWEIAQREIAQIAAGR